MCAPCHSNWKSRPPSFQFIKCLHMLVNENEFASGPFLWHIEGGGRSEMCFTLLKNRTAASEGMGGGSAAKISSFEFQYIHFPPPPLNYHIIKTDILYVFSKVRSSVTLLLLPLFVSSAFSSTCGNVQQVALLLIPDSRGDPSYFGCLWQSHSSHPRNPIKRASIWPFKGLYP